MSDADSDGSGLPMVVPALEVQIEEVARELAVRRRLYPKAVQAGQLGAKQAAWRIRVMEAVLQTLQTARQ